MTIKTVGRKKHHSIIKIDEFNTRKKHAFIRGIYGLLLVMTSVLMMAIDPVKTFTHWFLRMEEGSFIYEMWKEPPYQLHLEVYTFNYTNIKEFMSGEDSKLKIDEIGPFIFQEKRTNHNMSIDALRDVLTMTPNINLTFLPELSVGDTRDVRIIVPNLALIALSTLAADTMPWWTNQIASGLIRSLGTELFLNLTVEEYLWGYRDPLVDIASTIAPGWIDFETIGLLDRFYDQKKIDMEIELSNRNGNKYSIISYEGSPGLKEQGYTDLNSSVPCNLIKGSYEGLMLNPGVTPDTKLRMFRKQACRVYPFSFEHEDKTDTGITYYRYGLEKSSFSNSSEYACKCREPCLPEGFVDIAKCFYNFPIALTKPHYLDVDQKEMERYEGLYPNREKHSTFMDFEPTLSIPVKLKSSVQANIAVRSSRFNPITMPVNGHILPLMWFSMYCDSLPSHIATLLQLRLLYGPPAVIALEVLIIILGCWLLGTSIHRYCAHTHEITFSNKTKDEYEKSAEALL